MDVLKLRETEFIANVHVDAVDVQGVVGESGFPMWWSWPSDGLDDGMLPSWWFAPCEIVVCIMTSKLPVFALGADVD